MALEGQSPHTDKSPATSKINFVSCYILTFFVHSLGRARSSIFMQVFSTGLKSRGPLLSSEFGDLGRTVYSAMQHVERW